ncbi:MAG: hypothetical protein IPF83_08675 [Rhodanobacteraceae bacterium]|jgi:hypothetical protein|nr:hypothetical protein [Rhodanobacteraceae bacterium]MBK7044840.1 hypothetical protein [Rhodanobacteraceae bacterium]MBL0039641.1 hypothetical protein [Xanthomonadales bacterium]MBP9155829.1 hypothetical protein [Xanthomonadales bacterium]
MQIYKSAYFVPALSLALSAAMFRFDGQGMSWMWSDQPFVAALLAGASVAFWWLLFASREKRQG